MSGPTAYMLVLGMDRVPLDIVDLDPSIPNLTCVAVPGFGHMLAHPERDVALFTQGPGTEHERPVRHIDGRIECDLLHKADRLCVVVEP